MDIQNKSKEELISELQKLLEENKSLKALKEKRSAELIFAHQELVIKDAEKEKRAAELDIANEELAFQGEEKEKRAAELDIANVELAFQDEEKGKRAAELGIANEELAFQDEEKEKRALELGIANEKLAFQGEEKEKRAVELVIANEELAFQDEEKEKRAIELVIANEELAFQGEEKEKRAAELIIANKELLFENEEKDKRADELAIANKKLAFQNEEKDKRADELAIANKEKSKREYELILANEEKEKRADELVLANKELAFQNELEKNRAETESIAKELRQFIETANAPIFGIDSKGLVNEWNETSVKITGFKKEEVLGKDLVETYITEDYRNAVKQVLDNALKGKETANYEFPLFTKDGKRVIVLLNSSTRRNAAGEIVGVLGVGQDISEIDKLRTESESVAKELRMFIETANAPIFGIDSKGLVNEWNETSGKITGFKKEEVLGKDLVKTYITEDYRNAVKQVLDNALKGKETANYEFPLFTKDGKRVMVLLNSSTRRNAAGEIVGVLGVGQDISEMDKLRTESESVAKELRQFIETANAPIFGIDSKGLVNEWNETSEKITGFKKEEVLGKDLVKTYITEDYRDAVKQVLDNALEGKETANYEFPLFTKDGKRVMVLLNSSTRRDTDGKIVGVLGVGQDITILNEYKENLEFKVKNRTQELAFQNDEKDKRAAELVIANKELAFQNNEKEKRALELVIAKEKAEESDRLKSAFLANMSHEIRTPMNGILGFADLLREADLSGEEQQEFITIIETSGTRMLNIINDIISISKIESGLMEVNIQESNINQQIEFIYTFFKPQVEAKGMQFLIKKTLSEKEAFIRTDTEKVYSILTNIVKNAIKYTVEGSIELGYRLKKGVASSEIEFYIKDTGIGIHKDRHEAIFERFIQADIADKRAYQGAGLGLSISRAYAEMLGGRIWMESEEGKGSIFYLTLPYQTKLEEKIIIKNVDKSNEIVNPEISGLKVLIAEDDETNGMLISVIVKELKLVLLEATTGIEAVDLCRSNPDIDLILMDIQMPDLNGYEATRQIRQFNQDVIIIAQTAFGLAGDKEKSIEAGCNDYISKPFNKSKLLTVIGKYLKK
ncbi:MAG: PAS domain S-box protein [Salibacteraceae bacterium]|nr:PAS domain S-box protein [Salibacteraceae bacterium]|tara:strand:- start:50502 stop:53759 length:3258 start_codon:yes stop_codon:yes gene_type:complete